MRSESGKTEVAISPPVNRHLVHSYMVLLYIKLFKAPRSVRGPVIQRQMRRLVRPIPGSENQFADELQRPPAPGDGHEGSFGSPAKLPFFPSAIDAPRKVRSLARRRNSLFLHSQSCSCTKLASTLPLAYRCSPATCMKLSSMNQAENPSQGE